MQNPRATYVSDRQMASASNPTIPHSLAHLTPALVQPLPHREITDAVAATAIPSIDNGSAVALVPATCRLDTPLAAAYLTVPSCGDLTRMYHTHGVRRFASLGIISPFFFSSHRHFVD
jgi:hypothetical protein